MVCVYNNVGGWVGGGVGVCEWEVNTKYTIHTCDIISVIYACMHELKAELSRTNLIPNFSLVHHPLV